jgi:hypothetical protein
MSVCPFAKACDRRVREVALWQTGINRGYHRQSKEIGEKKEVYRSVGSISHCQSKSAKEKKARACQDNA